MPSLWIRTLAVAALLAATALPAGADVRYTMDMDMGHPGMAISTTTYVKGKRERVERQTAMGPVQMTNTTMTWCDKGENVQIDPDLKIYTVSPIGAQFVGAPPTSPMARPHPEGGGGTGEMTITYAIEDKGAEKIGELDTHHYLIHMHTQTSGCLGESDRTMDLEEWISSIPAFHCRAYTAPERSVENPSTGCKITYRIKGDVTGLGSVLSGMPVRMIMRSGDRQVMAMNLKDYSSAALDDTLFTVPADYKEVSREEFQRAIQEKMMRNMRMPGGMPPH